MPTKPVRILSALPEDEQENGLGEALRDRASLAPVVPILAVVLFRVDKLFRDVRTGETAVILRIAHIEPVEGDEATVVDDMLASALEDRLGVVRLPLTQDDTGS